MGMSMTEKQGGSDVRANTTLATPCENRSPPVEGDLFRLNGHKWFTSAPMSDAFLTLAQTKTVHATTGREVTGLSCFLVPRWSLQTQKRNVGFNVMRLKNKLGDHANASSEVEYTDAEGAINTSCCSLIYKICYYMLLYATICYMLYAICYMLYAICYSIYAIC